MSWYLSKWPEQRRYAYKPPGFKSPRMNCGPKIWKHSVYYLWWEYLRRNKDYEELCGGKSHPKLRPVFEDFGDIHSVDFEKWWSDGGYELFAEPRTLHTVRRVNDAVEADFVLSSNELVLASVPIDGDTKHLYREFEHMLIRYQTNPINLTLREASKAKYRVLRQPTLHTLRKRLEIFDLCEANPEMRRYEIGQLAKLNPGDPLKRLPKDEGLNQKEIEANQRKRLSSLTSRHYAVAERIICNVGLGKFPCLD